MQWLGCFVLPPDEQSISWSPNERSPFDKQPLLDTGSEIIAALPSALGAAIRETVIETYIQTGNGLQMRADVLWSQTDALHQNPMFRKARIPGAPTDLNNPLVPSPPVEIEPGYWVHCVLLVDDLEGFEDGGLWGTSSRGNTASPALQTEIEQASAFCCAQPGFKSGLTFIVICGFGRRIALGFDGEEGWLVEVVTDYDADVIGWLHNFDFSELIKLSTMDLDLRSKGFTLEALRVRPETLCRITEFSEHESNGRELDEGERVAVEVLPVLGQSAAAVEPGDGAFDHPTPGLDDEALHPIGSLDDLGLEIGQDAGQGAVKDRALIGAVGEQFPEKGKQTEQGRQQRETAVAILNVGGGDDAVQQQALRIDQNMPLLALDQLAGIEAVAVDASPPFSALFTL